MSSEPMTHAALTQRTFQSRLAGALCAAALLCSGLLFAAPAAAAIQGSCLGHFGSVDQVGTIRPDGTIERNDRVAVIVDSTEIRSEPSASGAVTGTLRFGERVYLENLTGEYLRVNYSNSQRTPQPALGWVHADTLLCRTTPLQTDEGLARKFYIRTVANFGQDEASVIEPAAAPTDGAPCAQLNNECQRLTRFSLFFIFAEDPATGRLLLLGQQVSETDTPLIGWVGPDDGFRWNSRYGLRPADNLSYDPGTGQLTAGSEIRVCLYETLELAAGRTGERCDYPILGGPRWFTSTIRIPILERVDYQGQPYLRVAMPIAGVGQDADVEMLDRLAGLDEAIAALQGLRNLDVFFLIDGTQSMDPHIDALVGRGSSIGVIPAIQNAFATDPRFRNVRVRYGYRVYRDTYTLQNFGMGESLRLGNNCAPTDAELDQNHRQVQDEIGRIDVRFGSDSGVRDTDHEENLPLGLAFAVDDMQGCPDNVKLLFVIGDTGFDSIRLTREGVPVTTEQQVVQIFADRLRRGAAPIVPFFIQVPRAQNQSSDNYRNAYALFTQQAQGMIGGIQAAYTADLRQRAFGQINENFYSLDGRQIPAAQADLVSYVLDRVANYGDQRPINEIIAGLQTGEALVQIMNALQEDASGIPALRLAQIERRVCDTLGAGCTQRVVSDVAEGYIPLTDDIVRDVLLSATEFGQWRDRLSALRGFSSLNEIELSRMIVNMMTTSVGSVIGELSPSELEMSVSDYLDLREGLPVSENTPLLSYSLQDFIAKMEGDYVAFTGREVATCELLYVARWLQMHYMVFDAVSRNEFPVIDFQPITDCQIRGTMQRLNYRAEARFPDERMSFSFVRMNALGYWVPEEFLP